MNWVLRLFVYLWLCSYSLALPEFLGAPAYLPGVHNLIKRNDCKTETVISGDGCGSLAKRCGISGADFTKANLVNQSSGTLPDIRPKPEPNGTCASYTVKENDTCSSIAAANGLKSSEVEDFNKVKTWGFYSCDNLGLGVKICLSDGDAPLPAPQKDAICGPTVPGTKQPPTGTNISDLNPCPLNACCNIWGQCGITGDFCVPTKGKFGNPGTGPTGSNGCASSCGREIVNNDGTPGSFISVGYYESWNMDRPCLTMKSKSIASLKYTHVHWGFGKIARDMSVSIDDTHKQWDDFKKLNASGIKVILSLGGWGDSTDPATYDILRATMSTNGRETFTNNVAKFANDEGLDGIDIDWEYPGAPDIPGIPPGQKEDGENYLAMLKMLRSKLDKSKTLSIAAPASYWYLRPFPISNMSEVVDYIENCPGGNCLRSHVNLTETMDALSMITKAGVSTKKVVVGVASYARSFKMADPNCSGPMCTFLGTNISSEAKPGKCTLTKGYISNAEINSIMRDKPESKTWHDDQVDADFIIYDSTEWASYMTDETKQSRRERWKNLNFAGTVGWALDLQEFSEDEGCPAGTCDSPDTLYNVIRRVNLSYPHSSS
ncbi:glycoside hydrolase family 18 protein [Daldinia caldariorum]|uniref:glycoside hydrolase family 18 protein n=1 Tax=Daldinia caldariorum TaxID=326644 RepID=UPI0020074078|nr:glycoside hydrolase family 18 protein [Daldinia caldariorum]KAI1465659.1 glycoside hydrolase family 18 protein [Daldinia caldariorum]